MWNTVPLIRADLLESQPHDSVSRQPLMNRRGWEELMEKLAANDSLVNRVCIEEENIT